MIASRILVVDDQPLKRHLYAHMLQDIGSEIVEVGSGEAALRACQEQEYAMILMDVHLTGIEGIDAARRIRERPDCTATSIVFVSAVYTSDMDLFRGYGEGAVDYLLAPVVPEILRAKAKIFTEIYMRRKQAEESARLMEQYSRRLKVANEGMTAFSYAVAHDLKAPLRAIGGYAEILLEDYQGTLDAPGHLYLQRIGTATQTATDLVDSLLKLGQVTGSEISCVNVDLSALAHEVAAELRRDSPRQVEWLIAPDLNVSGDVHLLRILLVNLLGNAWKYTAQCTNAKIEVGRERQQDREAFYVRDNGIGFDAVGAGTRLFVPFQRFHRNEEAPGIGIGLATVARIVSKHDGSVWAESAKQAGATFWFVLD